MKILSKTIGILFIFLSFVIWVSFDNPDINPFLPGAIFVSGVLSQIINWFFVSILATIGWAFFTLGKFTLK